MTLEQFLETFNSVVRQAVQGSDDPFYSERGLQIHAVEVRQVTCKDAETQSILMDIIQETTNRLNRIQKQHSENEVAVLRLQGEIEAEKDRGQLLELRHAHERREAEAAGEAEAAHIQAFFRERGDLSPADKIALFNTLRQQERSEALSTGNARLFLTPQQAALHLEVKE